MTTERTPDPRLAAERDAVVAAAAEHQSYFGKSIVHDHFLRGGVSYEYHTIQMCPRMYAAIVDLEARVAEEALGLPWKIDKAVEHFGEVVAAAKEVGFSDERIATLERYHGWFIAKQEQLAGLRANVETA